MNIISQTFSFDPATGKLHIEAVVTNDAATNCQYGLVVPMTGLVLDVPTPQPFGQAKIKAYSATGPFSAWCDAGSTVFVIGTAADLTDDAHVDGADIGSSLANGAMMGAVLADFGKSSTKIASGVEGGLGMATPIASGTDKGSAMFVQQSPLIVVAPNGEYDATCIVRLWIAPGTTAEITLDSDLRGGA